MYCLGALSNAPDYTYRPWFRKWLGARARASIASRIANSGMILTRVR